MAEQNRVVLLDIQLNYERIAKQISDTTAKVAALKAEQERLNSELKKAEASGNAEAIQRIGVELVKNTANIKAYNKELADLGRQSVVVAQYEKAEAGSYEQTLRALQAKRTQLKLLKETMDAGGSASVQLTEQYNREAAEVTRLSEAVIRFDQGIKDGRTNVGNYESSMRALLESLEPVTQKLADLKGKIEINNQALASGTISAEDWSVTNGDLTNQLGETATSFADLSEKIRQAEEATTTTAESTKSLKQQIREAKEEAQILGQKFGFDSEQAVQAQQKVAQLSEDLRDFNKRVEALNPERKFKAFTQVVGGLAGGIAAAQGAMALLGAESEDAQAVMVKLQGALAFSQGINQLMELGDAISNLRVLFGLTTVAKQAETVATAENTVAQVANVAAVEGLAVAETSAAASTGALAGALAFLTGPIGLVLLGITAAVGAFKLYESSAKAAKQSTDQLLDFADAAVSRSGDALQAQSEAISAQKDAAGQALALAEAQKKSETELLDIKKQSAREQGDLLDVNFRQNAENIARLEDYQQRLAARSAEVDDEKERAKIEKTKEAVAAKIEVLNKANEKIKADQDAADQQLEIDELKHRENLRKIAEQAAEIRLTLIKDGQAREIAQERSALAAKLEEIRGNTSEEVALRSALEAATAEKIAEIRRKYQEEELKNSTQLEIDAAAEGSQARIEAEAEAAKRLRDFALTSDKLTKSERLKVEQDYVIKLQALDAQRFKLLQDEAAREIELEYKKRDAKLAAQIANSPAGDQEQALALRLQLIQNGYERETAIIESNRQAATLANDQYVAKQLEGLQFSADFQAKTEEQKQATIAEIIQNGRDEEQRINDNADAEAIQKQAATFHATTEATQQYKDNKLRNIEAFKNLEIDAAGSPDEELAHQLELLDIQQAAELAAMQKSLKTQEEKAQAEVLMEKKYGKLREQITIATETAKLQTISTVLSDIGGLFEQGSEEYKAFAAAQIFVDTTRAAVAALAPPPTGAGPVLGEVLAGAIIIAGAKKAQDVLNYETPKFTAKKFAGGGFTVDEATASYNPRWVGSFSEGGPVKGPSLGLIGEAGPELVVRNQLLREAPAFFSAIERWNATGVRPFASGGFSDPTFALPSFAGAEPLDYQKLAEAVVRGVQNVQIVTDIREVITAQDNLKTTEARASI